MAILRRASNGEDERAENAEDRAAGTNGRPVLVERAGNRRADSTDEINQRKASRSEQRLVQRAELIQRPGVEKPVQPAAVEEHGGDEPEIFAALEQTRHDGTEIDHALIAEVSAGRSLVSPNGRDDDEERCRDRREARNHPFSSSAETRRMRRCASRGENSFNRM